MTFTKVVLALACLMSGTLVAQEAKVTHLLSKDLTNLPGKEGLMIAVEYPPGSKDPIHRHNAHAFAELLSFFAFPQHLWRKLRTTNVIERCFVEVRRRTRPMVCFVSVERVDRIIYSIFQRFNL